MADTFTTHYHWRMPEIGASANDWGEKWNTNLGGIAGGDTVDGIDAKLWDVETKADAALKIDNALSEFNNDTKRGNARANLGLGGAAIHSITSNNPAVAISGAGVAGGVPSFADTNGTIQNSGIAASDILTKSGNLADIDDQATARSNLGLRVGGTATFVSQDGPSGGLDGDIWVVVL